MVDQSFGREYRLRHRGEFRRVFARRATAADDQLLVFGCENGLPQARLGLSVSRKVGGAVLRNRWKRLIREAFRLRRPDLPAGVDFVVVPRNAGRPELGPLLGSLPRLARKVAARLRATRDAPSSSEKGKK